MRRFIVSIAATAAALTLAGTASADAPTIFSDSLSETTPSPNFSCRPHGYAFDLLATFNVNRRYIQFHDDGALVKEIRQVKFTGTLYRADDLSKTIPYGGNWTRTFLVEERLVVNTGLTRYSHADGSGMVTLDPGRTVFTWPPPVTELSDTGPTLAEYERGVCAYLAAA